MQSFLRKLKEMCSAKTRTIVISGVCAFVMLSTPVLTGIASFNCRVEIYDNGQFVKSVLTNKQTADEILNDLGVETSANDEVLWMDVDNNHANIRINRAFDVSVTADGKTVQVPMVRGTVQDALELANVAVGSTDTVSEDVNNVVKEGTSITVVRVTTNEVAEQVELPFETIYQETDGLLKGVTQEQTAGSTGTRVDYYSCTYEDGNLVSRSEQPVRSEVTVQPVNRVVLVGTKTPVEQKSVAGKSVISELDTPAVISFDGNGIPTNYTKVITGRGVAYTAPAGARTSTGRTVKPGYVAVNPNVIPYGTKMYIASADGRVYGYAIAADTGGSCMKNEILVDLFMNSEGECRNWGSRTVNIYILP